MGCKEDGGLRLANLKARDNVLKIQWIFRLHTIYPSLTALAYFHIKPHVNNSMFWQCTFADKDIGHVYKAKDFWLSVVQTWPRYNCSKPKSKEQILNQIIWLNWDIRVADKPIFYEELYNGGIHEVKDLCVNNKSMSSEDFSHYHGPCLDRLGYFSLISAFTSLFKKSSSDIEIREVIPKYVELLECESSAKQIYDTIIKNENLTEPLVPYL